MPCIELALVPHTSDIRMQDAIYVEVHPQEDTILIMATYFGKVDI